ncbi:MAG: COX15/CtaA family protein [Acidisphaera sp.]|nr:COX15/CtaA family protein [Acidisphaera sp.]
MAIIDPAARDRQVGLWLLGMAGMILVMIVLGGATRATGSGLSIMEWAPVSGALPPLSEREWRRLFALYQQIPQYQLLHQGFGLSGFKHIFWLEWVHRLWGRLLGFGFFVPLLWFWSQGRIDRRLLPRLALLFVLGGLQGAVGWFMVASGFLPDSIAVSQYRLVVHLALALALYAAILWTGLSLLRPVPAGWPGGGPTRRLIQVSAGLLCLTIIAGGFVAGLHAGLDYNTFPLMDGRLVPAGYAALEPFARNLTENLAAVQFDHRVLATLSVLAILATAGIGLSQSPPPGARRCLLALGALALAQYALGVTTLLLVVPEALAVLHQTLAVLLLTAALASLHATRRLRAAPSHLISAAARPSQETQWTASPTPRSR